MTSHHRRGELGWNLETIGKLIIGVATLILIVYLSMKLVEIFIGSPSAAYGADRNLQMIDQRISLAQQTGEAQSLIISIPGNAFIVGFDAEEDVVQEEASTLGIEVLCDKGFIRPKQCPRDEACLCSYGVTVYDQPPKSCALPTVYSCIVLDGITSVSGTYEPVNFDQRTLSADIGKFDLDLVSPPDPYHPGYTDAVIFALSTGPRSLHVGIYGKNVILSHRDMSVNGGDSQGVGQGGSFGGGGATATY